MRATDIIGWAYCADLYCEDCGHDLPRIDSEGNARSPIFCGSEADYMPYCAACGALLDGYSLTDEGLNHVTMALESALADGDDATVAHIWDYLRPFVSYGGNGVSDWAADVYRRADEATA